jgi:hypothetical protein
VYGTRGSRKRAVTSLSDSIESMIEIGLPRNSWEKSTYEAQLYIERVMQSSMKREACRRTVVSS